MRRIYFISILDTWSCYIKSLPEGITISDSLIREKCEHKIPTSVAAPSSISAVLGARNWRAYLAVPIIT